MSRPILPGSYTSLFSQRLLQTILQMSTTNPQAAVTSPFIAQVDASLLGNVQSIDGMLSMIGLSTTSGTGMTNPGGGFINTLGNPGLGGPAAGQVGNTGLIGGGLSLTA